MPLIYVQRYAPSQSILAGGTQYVDGTLAFTGSTTIYLPETIYNKTGRYVLFDYSASGASFPNKAQLNNVTINTDDLTRSIGWELTDDPSNGRILLDLTSRLTNGKQFVDGDLVFTGPTTVYLSDELYATAGTYELFEVAAGKSITGESFLNCVSIKGLTTVSVTKIGNIVYVTLA